MFFLTFKCHESLEINMDKSNFCVIMAGGIGSRFWPLSKTSRPKQFLDILGTGKTLLQQTFERFVSICPGDHIFIVTNKEYAAMVREQLPDIDDRQILLEPMRKNTAPCIAYANYRIQQIDPDANIIVAPSDHLILKENEFHKVLRQGLEFVKTHDALLTLGIQPNRPETGYGYIQVNSGKVSDISPHLMKVKTFTEKPDIEMARVFIESGEFYWNSGLFMWSLRAIQSAFNQHLSEVAILFNELQEGMPPEDEEEAILQAYSDTRNISIDYGVMEKAENVFVLCSDFGWSDLGTWSSLYDHSEKDHNGNAINGENVLLYDSKNNIINTQEEKLVAIQGLEDCIVVESDKVLLICRKQDEQKIKQMVNDVKILKGDTYI